MADKKIKLIFSKTEDGKYLVDLSSIYPRNCSEQKTVIVDDDVLAILIESQREQERERSRIRRHINKFIYLGEDENFDAMLGLVADAPDTAVESDLYLEYIKRFFDRKVYERGILYYLHKFSLKEIAEMDGVSEVAIFKSISKFKKIMLDLYKKKLE